MITGVGAVVNTARVRPGARVAVIGAGGVGLNAIQGAALAGASRIVAVDIAAAKLDAARAFGATDGVLAGPDAAARGARPRPAAAASTSSSSPSARPPRSPAAAGLLAAGGAVVVVGMPPAGVMVDYDPTTPRLDEPAHRRLAHGPRPCSPATSPG